jgi:predicted DNA-binding transcriptional regulator YafY
MYAIEKSPNRRRKRSRRGDLTERLIKLLLLLAERPHSQSELAGICRVNNVTIRRNLTELSRHYFIVDERRDREIVYQFGDNYEFRPPTLTPGELATLLLAQQTIAGAGITAFGTPFGKYGYTLLEKVRAALPKALREKLDVLATIFGSAAMPAKDYSAYAETIDRLTNAAMSHRRVRMRYYTLHSGKTNDRLFEPYSVYFDPDGATLKVIGYDHQRKNIIPLSIDHILSLSETDEIFTRPPNYTLSGFLTENCFNGIHGEPLTVRLRAFGVTARVFAERTFHLSQREIVKTTDRAGNVETITVEMRVARGRGLERFILSWLPEVEVLEPMDLRRKIAAILDQSLRQNAELK